MEGNIIYLLPSKPTQIMRSGMYRTMVVFTKHTHTHTHRKRAVWKQGGEFARCPLSKHNELTRYPKHGPSSQATNTSHTGPVPRWSWMWYGESGRADTGRNPDRKSVV